MRPDFFIGYFRFLKDIKKSKYDLSHEILKALGLVLSVLIHVLKMLSCSSLPKVFCNITIK